MRITEKYKKLPLRFLYESEDKYNKDYQECEEHNKLVDLENIEDELGIELITLFKAFKNGIWMKFGDQIVFHKAPDKTLSENIAYFRRLFEKEYAQNYGKTWALTKEELL